MMKTDNASVRSRKDEWICFQGLMKGQGAFVEMRIHLRI